MSPKKYQRILLVLFAFILAGGALVAYNGSVVAQTDKGMDRLALEAAATQFNAPVTNLEIGNLAIAEYPNLKQTIYNYKIVDRFSGEIYNLGLDAAGQPVDLAKLDAAEAEAMFARYGRFEPALSDWLSTAQESDVIDVSIYLKAPDVTFDKPDPTTGFASKEEEDAFYAAVDAQQAALIEPVVAPVANYLMDSGYQVVADKYTPVVFATLPTKMIKELGSFDTVDRIYIDPKNESTLNIAYYTTRADIVYARRISGFGVRLGEIEVGGRVNTSNPYLASFSAGMVQDTTYSCLSGHTAAVAGIIRSIHPTYFGLAPASALWIGGSCGGSGSELVNRSTAAMDWGARSLNLSWGHDSARTVDGTARWYDTNVINRWRSFIIAAGNTGGTGCTQGTNGNVWSPGTAFNVVTVGNFDDKNSITWTGDTMNFCSSWRDPLSTNGDREKPEVAAPGTNIVSTTNASPWTAGVGSGTSYAAPVVTGVSGLMLNRAFGTLNPWPESVKAILMASAIHNIEGAARLSEYDGAGAVVADYADNVVRRYNGNWGGMSYTCSTTTPLNVASMSLTAGVVTRVAIAWDNNPAYSLYASKPSADIDLRVVNAAGTTVASSLSFDNTYEIVQFTPAVTGTYYIRINRVRCDYTPAYLGWAWRK